MLISLYVHFPFCLRKCLYCDFNSNVALPQTREEYVADLIKEMELRRGELDGRVTATTLYFGGGTPSLMEPREIARIVDASARLFNLSAAAEVTMEANPGTLSPAGISAYRSAGVNRLSLGLQSLSDHNLALLGRIHTSREAVDCYAAARRAGFDNVSIDLIHSLPGQTPAAWLDELAQAVCLRPDHISAYALTVEEGTPFQVMADQGRLLVPDEEEGATMFVETARFLGDAGYEQYEISSFALPGFRSRHNQVYWRRDNYLGFGAGAHSFLKRGFGKRWRNSMLTESYCCAIRAGFIPEEEVTVLTERDAMAEFFFLGLRMRDGVKAAEFERQFGCSVDTAYPGTVSKLLSEGLLESVDGFLRLTDSGIVVANQVLVRFV